jgi:hypothetical protein
MTAGVGVACFPPVYVPTPGLVLTSQPFSHVSGSTLFSSHLIALRMQHKSLQTLESHKALPPTWPSFKLSRIRHEGARRFSMHSAHRNPGFWYSGHASSLTSTSSRDRKPHVLMWSHHVPSPRILLSPGIPALSLPPQPSI